MIADDHAAIRARLARVSQQSVADPSVADPSPVDIVDREKLKESNERLLAEWDYMRRRMDKIPWEARVQSGPHLTEARVERMAKAAYEIAGFSWEKCTSKEGWRARIRAALAVYDEPKPMTATEILKWREKSFGSGASYDEATS